MEREAGTNEMATPDVGLPPIVAASGAGYQVKAEDTGDFVDKMEVKAESATEEHDDPCDVAAINGDVESLKLYMKNNYVDGNLLVLAVRFKRWDTIRFLLDDYKIDVNSVLVKDQWSVLHEIAKSGDVAPEPMNSDEVSEEKIPSVLRELLDQGGDITISDKLGQTALHVAADSGRHEIAREILKEAKKRNAVQHIINKTHTVGDPLYLIRGRHRGRPVWHYLKLKRMAVCRFPSAMSTGHLDIAQYGQVLFSGFGDSPDAETRKKIQKLQDEALANPKPDVSPLHVATNKQNEEVVKVLLEYGADPDIQDRYGVRPSHYAAMRGNLSILVALVKGGAHLDVLTDDGESLIGIAEANEHQHIQNYLKGSPLVSYGMVSKQFLSI